MVWVPLLYISYNLISVALMDRKPLIEKTQGMNTLGLLVFSIVFGIVLGRTGEVGKPVVAFFHGVMVAMVKVVMLIIW